MTSQHDDKPERVDLANEGPVRPSMSEQELRDAGIAIDVPFEVPVPTGETQLRYSDGKTLEDELRADSPELFDDDEVEGGSADKA